VPRDRDTITRLDGPLGDVDSAKHLG